MTETLTIKRLVNPYATAKPCARVQADISAEDFDYLFKGVLSTLRGSQSCLIGTILQKLIHELRAHNLPAHYDPTHESIVAGILSRCTFGGTTGDAVSRNVGGGEKKTSRTHKAASIKSADAQGKGTTGKQRAGKEAKTKEQETQG